MTSRVYLHVGAPGLTDGEVERVVDAVRQVTTESAPTYR